MMKRLLCATAFGLALTGCATLLEGTTQTIAVETPGAAGAQCTLYQAEKRYFLTTPGSVVVDKSKHDITIACKKWGYEDGFLQIESLTEGATLGNLVAGGFIGYGIDAATGAANQYPSQVSVTLVKRRR